MQKTDILNKIYYDINHPASLSSSEKLYKAASVIVPSLTRREVNDWLITQNTYTLHKNARRTFSRNMVYASYPNEQWQADLVEMIPLKKFNSNYAYILTVIDVYSKFAFASALHNKEAETVRNAFSNIFTPENKPDKLQTDMGKEFANKRFRKYCTSLRINFFTSKSDNKCAVIERFNRTLKSKLFKYFTSFGTRRWVDVLENIISTYNNTDHSSILNKPNNVYKNGLNIFKNIYKANSKRDILKSKSVHNSHVKENDSVRLQYKLSNLDKGYYPNWTDRIEHVEKVIKGCHKPYYKLQGIEGKFYPEEIQKVLTEQFRFEKIIKSRKKNNSKEYFLKWIGYDNSHNSWIPESSIINLKK